MVGYSLGNSQMFKAPGWLLHTFEKMQLYVTDCTEEERASVEQYSRAEYSNSMPPPRGSSAHLAVADMSRL